jgi:hypothetical protein
MTPKEEESLAKLKVYMDDAMKVSVGMKGYMLSHNNMHGYVSAQSAIDVLLDIKSIIAGGKIASLAEMEKAVKKAESEKRTEKGSSFIYS